MTPTPLIPSYLPETPSQTAGPYVHIGLIPEQAGFEIFENNFSGDIAGPAVAGERIIIEGRIIRWCRPCDKGRAGRDLAGQCGRAL
jgi:protocatechuate 3,4-dioxygenase alpha subunit